MGKNRYVRFLKVIWKKLNTGELNTTQDGHD